MIISKTPYRVSFFGGGTDYPVWYHKEGGAVLSTTIDKYCYISCRFLPPFFTIKHRIVWSHIETIGSISEILHPVVREGLRFLGFDDSEGLEIHHQGDLPARAGIGSSSSFSVGLINALMGLKGQCIGKHELAIKAIELEQSVLKENVGSQDQVAAAYGGFNIIQFARNGEIEVQPISISPARLAEVQARLMLFYTGTSRLASEVAGEVLAHLGQRTQTLLHMRRLVDRAISILCGQGSLDDFGKLLHEGWMLKRELSPVVSNNAVDCIYQAAIDHGALGGKLLGAGASGFMVFYVPEGKEESVLTGLSRYLHVPFEFESKGSTLLVDGSHFEG